MQAVLPFTGFYNSEHQMACDDALESMFQTDCGTLLRSRQFEDAWEHVDWKKVYKGYACLYTKNVADLLDIEINFESLDSPREYNFTTDRLIVEISLNTLNKLFEAVDKDRLSTLVKEKFTSCSGFISFYDNDLKDWPEELEDWDHNQLGTLLEAVLDDDFDQYIMEHDFSYISDLIATAGNDKFQRLVKLGNYLWERAERN